MNIVYKILPNIITLSRILLTYVFLLLQNKQYHDIKNRETFLCLSIVFLCICITDLIDGKIARFLNSKSFIGSLLDVAADAAFIFSSFIFLNIHGIIPFWFTIVILSKFVEFIITSYVWKKLNNKTSELFISDPIGKLTAVLFYIIPGIVGILFYKFQNNLLLATNTLIFIATTLSVISSCIRCSNCFKHFKRIP
ncbi:CDP-alcohol phosphatidyltransferase family protein [Clostridium pasteurianum]|uniref:Phosphatidylglycerophosphate synthase n=1 Tax=Clostridium pasteurianum BC1 TaxID=86416 RepID=R4K4U8_CLOPA|nr:CDP-alcohol phosphatidyltransferase family protein [Clostridium pasteurianum]AGK95539.1 phosphatidylglycerophosphate synthase [Clostridium pasteurianum BC1]